MLELSSFLDPRFELNYVNNRAEVLEEIESQMIECLVDDSHDTTTSLFSASNMSQCGESGDTVITVPPRSQRDCVKFLVTVSVMHSPFVSK